MAANEDQAPKGKKALTDEQRRDLLVHHIGLLRAGKKGVEAARLPLTEAQDTLTALVNTAKADLGKDYTRKVLMQLVDDTEARARDLTAEEKRRKFDREALGLPVYGVQLDLFSEAGPQEAKDEIGWNADGYLAGRRAAEPKPPQDVPARFVQAWMNGYHKGQEENAKALARGAEVAAAQGQPDASAEPVNLNQDDEANDPGSPENLRKAANRLKSSGFMERQPEPALN